MREIQRLRIQTDGGVAFDVSILESRNCCKASLVLEGGNKSWKVTRNKEGSKVESTLDKIMANILDIVTREGYKPVLLALR